MAHDDRRRREGTRQIDDIGELRMIEPGVKAEAERREPRQPSAKIRAGVEARLHVGAAVADGGAGVIAGRMAHAAKAAAAGPQLRQQHRLDPVAERQIGIADDAGGDPGLAVIARRAHRRDAGDEVGLADRAHLGRAIRPVHRAAFLEHGRDNVMAGVEVGEQFVEQIGVVAALPQMMVRIDDRQVGIEDRLGRGRRQPGFVGCVDPAELPFLPRRCHRRPPNCEGIGCLRQAAICGRSRASVSRCCRWSPAMRSTRCWTPARTQDESHSAAPSADPA